MLLVDITIVNAALTRDRAVAQIERLRRALTTGEPLPEIDEEVIAA